MILSATTSHLYVMRDAEQPIQRKDAQITGREEGPYRPDGTDDDVPMKDNRNRPEQENSANGLDSVQVRGGQDGRNVRGMGSTDMDSANGLLRFNDQDDDQPSDVTEEGMDSVAGSSSKTNTGTVNVTTHGPDDYASADEVPTPKAEKDAKKQDGDSETAREDSNSAGSQEEKENDVSQTGTSTSHQPTY